MVRFLVVDVYQVASHEPVLNACQLCGLCQMATYHVHKVVSKN
jgi:hypothetical protein